MIEEKKEKKVNKVLNVIIDVFTVIMVLFSALLIIIGVSSKNNNGVPTVGSQSYLYVTTESMTGTIDKGDLIAIKNVKFSYSTSTDNYQPNIEIIKNETIISFFYDIDNDGTNEVVTHKVIDIQNNGSIYVTQGTYAKEGDVLASQIVSYSSVIGVYEGIRIPVVGSIFNFLLGTKYCWGFALVVLVPIFIVFLFKGYKLIVTIIETKEENAKELAVKTAQISEEEKEKQKAMMREEILKELGIDKDKQ